jgi:hypothetical protein
MHELRNLYGCGWLRSASERTLAVTTAKPLPYNHGVPKMPNEIVKNFA